MLHKNKKQWPDTAEDHFFNGRQWQKTIADMRPKEALTLEKIYSKDLELFDWWMRPDKKHNSR